MGILAGRDQEMAVLVEQASAALSGSQTASVVVIGDPGVGKTALVEAAVVRLQPDRVVRIVGHAAERTVPLAAARDLLQLVAEHEGLDDLKGVLTDPVGVSERSYQAVVANAPLMLVVDDLQWVDPLTIGLVHYITRGASAGGDPLATLVASRASAEASDFVDSVRRVLPPDLVHVVELAPLTRAAGIAVARSVEPGLDEIEAGRLWERARGSPFWMRALLQDRGTSSTRDLALRRLRDCSDDASVLASMLALATRPLSRRDAAEILEWAPERVAGAASELVDRGIAVSEGRIMHLVHDLIRDALTASLERSLCADLHRRLGGWLERLGAEDPAALVEALGHVRAGGMDAAGLALRIATSPGRRLLGAQAVQELVRVSEDLQWGTPQRVELDESIAQLGAELGDQGLAFARWSSVSEQAPDLSQRAKAALRAARAAAALDRPGEADRLLGSDAVVTPPGSPLHVERLALEASLLESLYGRPDAARACAQEAMDLARAWLERDEALSGEASAAYLQALRTTMSLAKMEDDEAGVAQLAEEAVGVARQVDDREHLEAVLRMATVRPRTELVEAVQRVREVWEEANRRVLPTIELQSGFWLAILLAEQGCLADAENVIDSVRLLSMRVGAIEPTPRAISFAASLAALSRGPWQPALEALTTAAQSAGVPHFTMRAWQHVGQWEARLRGPVAATSIARHLDAAFEASSAAQCSRCSRELRLGAAEAFALVGEVGRALPLLEEWDQSGKAAHAYWGLVRRRVGALVARTAGGAAAAEPMLASVLTDSEAFGLGRDALWDGLHLGRAQIETDRAAAADTFRSVAAKASEGGARTEQAIAEQELRRLGVRTWARQSTATVDDALAALTAREREIADLVAAGASNPDIANQLFVSRKTVERHVSNVLAKLGTRNRAQLAALVSQQATPSDD